MNKWLITLTTTLVVLVVAAFALHREQRVERSVDIAAPPEKVWSVLTEFAAYPEWNPFMREASGTPKEGEKLRIVLNSGDSEMTFTPTVLAAEPGKELRWLGRVFVPGLLDGEHSFTLTPIPGGVRLTQSETFSGALVPFFGGSIDVGDDFAAMNRALRDRVESTANIAR
ncbi:SRPBCC domain-containing protein [Knoellia sp. S7-12]|uniref:SRPBCC domain-containing protein n=1 Tax=Knoellia sp. S7-12 TaxID=3126698 RepID=UPI003367CFC2